MSTTPVFDVNDYFFIVDSEKLNNVESKLYGFIIINGQIVENEIPDFINTANCEGCYVLIRRTGNMITITQDLVGSYGIYCYSSDGHFVFSNSFALLSDYLKNKTKLTFNQPYSDFLLVSRVCPYSVKETLINEITILDRNTVVTIDILEKTYTEKRLDLGIESVDLQSVEGLDILDKWFEKWCEIIRSIYSKTRNISTDLSGGFDSRLVLSLFINSGIDLNSIYISSANDDMYTHSEDFRIASQIASDFDFKLNNRDNISISHRNYSLEEVVKIAQHSDIGFHKHMIAPMARNNLSRYRFTGDGGGVVHGFHCNQNPKQLYGEYHSFITKRTITNPAVKKNVDDELSSNLELVRQKYAGFGKNLADDEIWHFLFIESRLRHHAGRTTVKHYLSNTIIVSPLIDADLWKLKSKPRLLPAVIIYRYCKPLLHYDIEGNRTITEEEILSAKTICDLKPYSAKRMNRLSHQKDATSGTQVDGVSCLIKNKLNNYYLEKVNNEQIRDTLNGIVDPNIIRYAINYANTVKYHPLCDVYALLATYQAYVNCGLSEYVQMQSTDLLSSPIRIVAPSKHKKEPITTIETYSRLDVLFTGSEEGVRVSDIDDESAEVFWTDWNKPSYSQLVIIPKSNVVDIKLDVREDGRIRIRFKSKQLLDEQKNKIPLWVDYKRIVINGKPLINEVRAAWHDQPIQYELDVRGGDVIHLSYEWRNKPHDDL